MVVVSRCARPPAPAVLAVDEISRPAMLWSVVILMRPPAHIVVLGAGFGGLEFCHRFRHPSARIALVGRSNHHLFQPLLYQVATAGLSAPEIAQPVRSILSRRPNIAVLLQWFYSYLTYKRGARIVVGRNPP